MLRKMRNNRAAWLAVFCLAVSSQPGCGGGGGGGNDTLGGLPVAPPPSCSALVPAVHLQTASQMQARLKEPIIVPATSVEHASDIGLRAHTNHLILAQSTRLVGPSGFSPAQIHKAYSVPNGGAGAIALVDAFNYPTALNDFNVFSNQFGLPTESSTTVTASSNTVFRVVYATGSKPTDDGGWAQESALDTQWAHSMAPNAKIYLVEAASDTLDDLATAVNVAKNLPGVKEVVMSFGATETSCEFATYDGTFVKGGVVFFAAAGDDAGNRDFPGESNNVVCVGGTHLTLGINDAWASESAWDGTACGPSAFEPRPLFQNVVFDQVGKYRGACDIAADGDPATGVSVYDSFPYQGVSGWQTYGGTSAAAPIIAGIANTAQSNRSSSRDQNTAFYAALGSSNFHDVASGSAAGFSAAVGWDFPTGVGTPNGLGGF